MSIDDYSYFTSVDSFVKAENIRTTKLFIIKQGQREAHISDFTAKFSKIFECFVLKKKFIEMSIIRIKKHRNSKQ